MGRVPIQMIQHNFTRELFGFPNGDIVDGDYSHWDIFMRKIEPIAARVRIMRVCVYVCMCTFVHVCMYVCSPEMLTFFGGGIIFKMKSLSNSMKSNGIMFDWDFIYKKMPKKVGFSQRNVYINKSFALRVSIPVFMSLSLTVSLSLCFSLSEFLSVSLSLCLSVFLFFCLSIYLSLCLSVYLSVFVSLSHCLSASLSFCLSISLSVCVCLGVWFFS